jgi:5-methylcytosine-specific restriction protein A
VRATGPSSAVRQSVHERDGDRCVHCGTFDSLQVHHRRARAMGGTVRSDTNSPANLVLLCLSCHARVESQRDWARDRGLLLRQSQTPAEVPLVWHGCRVLLGDGGWVFPLPGACPVPGDACTDQTPCPSCPRGAA